jgi:Ca2+-binding RTX toxin-like protein
VLRGGSGNDTIFGFEGSDRIEGGGGNDELIWGNTFAPVGLATLDGGSGNDVLRGGLVNGNMLGGSGDDTLILGRFSTGPVGAPPPTVDGGTGFDTLVMGPRPVLDLTGIDARNLGGIEKIDMGEASPGQQLILDMAALLNLSASTDTLVVAGASGDQVTAEGAWLAGGTQTIDGILYNQWTAGSASLLVESDLSFSIA